MANIFVSYRFVDAHLATKLADEIRDRGHHVWLDLWHIKVGDSIVERINEGLSGANYLVMCLSSAGSLTPWMGREWMATLARQLGGQDVSVLPVRLSGGEPPAILADVRYADLVDDWAAGVDVLCAAIR